jgi:hypothetical protein
MSNSSLKKLTSDTVLGGRIRLFQPETGYRVAIVQSCSRLPFRRRLEHVFWMRGVALAPLCSAP